MNMFWSLIKGFNDILINSLSCESNTHEGTNIKESSNKNEWYKQLHYSTDDEIDRYLEKNGLYYSIENDGRYKCEKILIDYFVDRNIDVYRV